MVVSSSAMNIYAIIFATFLMLRIARSELEFTNDISDAGAPESSVNHVFELTQSVNLARQEHIQKTCDNLHTNLSVVNMAPENLEHILVDHQHKLLYCYVPKVACTNWKRILMILSNKWNDTNVLSIPASLAHSPGMFPNLGNMSETERGSIVENYTKLIFVRHPFERLLSAYRNKLEDESPSASYFQQRVGRMIIKRFRSNPVNSSLNYGNDVTFEEFVEFLTSPQMGSQEPYAINEHWESIDRLCHPCAIKYNIIGRYETLLDDSVLALHTINASHISFPRDTRTSGTAEKLKKYYGPLDLELVRNLYNIYMADFKLFNYNLEGILGFDLG